MNSYYSKIEDYINNQLSEKESLEFEAELKTNSSLKERFEFYKKLSSDSNNSKAENQFNYNKKILPTIINTNLQEQAIGKNKQSKLFIYSSFLVLVLFFTALNFLYLPTKSELNESKLSFQNKTDSLNSVIAIMNKKIANLSNKTTPDTISFDAETVTNNILVVEIKKQKESINLLKKELADTKQILYANSNTAGSNNTFNIKAKIVDKTILEWNSPKKIAIKLFNIDGQLLHSGENLINEFTFPNLAIGLYRLLLIPENSTSIKKIIEIKSDKIIIWELQ